MSPMRFLVNASPFGVPEFPLEMDPETAADELAKGIIDSLPWRNIGWVDSAIGSQCEPARRHQRHSEANDDGVCTAQTWVGEKVRRREQCQNTAAQGAEAISRWRGVGARPRRG